MGMQTLEDLYAKNLQDLYNSEIQIINQLPRMLKKVASPDLKNALDCHLELTELQIKRLEKLFQNRQMLPCAAKCAGMEGLLEEGEAVIEQVMVSIFRDTALIGAVKKVKQYEISAYETACNYAHLQGDEEAVNLFTQTLDEEFRVEEELTEIADGLSMWMGHIYTAPMVW